MIEEEKKSSADWFMELHHEKGVVILDPDGWDRSNFYFSFNEEPITKKEYLTRLGYSTIIGIDKLIGGSNRE